MAKSLRTKACELIKKLLLINFVVDLVTKNTRKRIEHWLDTSPNDLSMLREQLPKASRRIKAIKLFVATDDANNEDFFFEEVLVIEVRFACFTLLRRQDSKPQLLRVNGKGERPWGKIMHLAKLGNKNDTLILCFYHQDTIGFKDQVLKLS